MTATIWQLPLPSGKIAEVREVTIGDLEAVGADWDKLARRVLVSVDSIKDDKTSKWPVRTGDYSAIVAWVQRMVNPDAEAAAAVDRSRIPYGLEVRIGERVVTLEEPDVETYQSATDYGRAGLSGGLRLLRRCITTVGGKPMTYAGLVSDWPFSASETLILHAELVYLLSEPVDEREAREGRARAIAGPRA